MAGSVSPKKKANVPASQEKKTAGGGQGTGGDIRNFFSQGSNGGPSKPAVTSAKQGTGKQPITIDDSDDEEDVKPAPKAPTSKSEAATTKASSKPIDIASSPEPAQAKPKAKAKPAPNKAESSTNGNGKRKPNYLEEEEDSEEEEIKPARKRQSVAGPGGGGAGRAGKRQPNYLEDSDSEEEQEEEVIEKPATKAKPRSAPGSTSEKAKAKKEPSPMDVDDESESDNDDEDEFIDDDDEDLKPKKAKGAKAKGKPAPKKPAPAPAAKKTTPKKPVKAEPEPAGDPAEEKPKPKPKSNFAAFAAARAAGPKNPGGKPIPEGAPECLAGLTFVFTGELETLGRDEAVELAKRFGGRVTGAPSKKTDYVVVGENAGESKLKKISGLGLQTLNEDEFLNLIATRKGAPMDEKAIKAKEKEEKKIEDAAKEMEKREKEEEQLRKRKEQALAREGVAVKKVAPPSSQLWTTKYAPSNLKEICGNKANVERLGQWLSDWDKNYKSGFKKPGKDGMGIYRAVLISGPPGIGKTTSAHLMAKEAGYSPIELNASDARSKKLVENSTNIDNASLDGFFKGSGIQSTSVAGVRIDSKTCLIMDEVDGMSAGDRGGVGALNGLIKKTRIPMILICNDRTLQKMKPLMSTTFGMTFKRPQPNEVRSRIMSILHKEKMKVAPTVVDELVRGANSDIRLVLNMLSTYKLSQSEMDFDAGKALVKINEKNTILTPFTIIDRLTSPYSFSRTNRESLNDKMELYFHDFSFVPLFMQEHYLKTNLARTQGETGPMKALKDLEHVSKASDWISDGDLVDRMIHGSEQHWSLLPFHAVTSSVAPAYHIYGSMRNDGGGRSWGPSFPQWLGQNSKQGKLGRQLTDIQIRMRLKASGSRQEIRETYMPMLASKIVSPLVNSGSDAVEEVIEYMDEYYLGKDDWDAFVELGVDTMKDDLILKKIPTAVKTAFTRQYNKTDHPIAFHKGDMFAASKRKIADAGPVADNEEVFEEDEPVPEEPESDKGEDDQVNDVSKDKLIKAVKAKAKGKEGATAKGKKK